MKNSLYELLQSPKKLAVFSDNTLDKLYSLIDFFENIEIIQKRPGYRFNYTDILKKFYNE